MAIHTRWGCPATITKNLGEHFPKGFECPFVLLEVEVRHDDGVAQSKFCFMHDLRADGGAMEVVQAACSAAPVHIRGAELKAAIQAAL
jgi:hypothetical protein